jgi:hypothetical protein
MTTPYLPLRNGYYTEATNIWQQWIANTSQTTSNLYRVESHNLPTGATITNNTSSFIDWRAHYRPATVHAWERWDETIEQRRKREWTQNQGDLIRKNRARTAQLRVRIAARKAEQLLLEHLTEAQRQEWQQNERFHFTVGPHHYTIRRGRAGNITLLDRGRRQRFCFHTTYDCPVADNVLAQKLFIESDEQAFLQLANRA